MVNIRCFHYCGPGSIPDWGLRSCKLLTRQSIKEKTSIEKTSVIYCVDEDVGKWTLSMEMFFLLEERIGDIFQYRKCTKHLNQEFDTGTSLVVQWLRICLPKQGTWVRSLVQEDSTCHRATKPLCHDYRSLCALGLTLFTERSHHHEKLAHQNQIPVSGRSPGEVKGNLLQYSCPENSMDR